MSSSRAATTIRSRGGSRSTRPWPSTPGTAATTSRTSCRSGSGWAGAEAAVKRVLLLLILAAGGYFAYRHFSQAGPIKAYESFADNWVRSYDDQALKFADPAAMKTIPAEKSREYFLHSQLIDAYHGVQYTIQDFREGNGDVVLQAKQVLSYDPPGVTSALFGGMVVAFRHVVTLKKTRDGWRVVSFEPTLIENREFRQPPPTP